MLEHFQGWYKQPFRSDQDAFQWFLFMGLLILISTLWSLILRSILE